MTAVTVTGTSSEVFDPWLTEYHWAPSTLTFSFPTDGSFYSYQARSAVTSLNAAQKAAVRRVLEEIESFTGLSFLEITETRSNEATLRFATEVGLAGGYAYFPSSGELGGDSFFGSATTAPVIGNEAYIFFIHEIGHAMGLTHGHESPQFVATGLDSQEYTVVTYSDYVGDTEPLQFVSGAVDWAQSYQQLDIAAMQFLYGANFAASGEIWSGDTVYSFDPGTGEMFVNGAGQGAPAGNRIFRTIWDGNGTDTYDLSNYATDLSIDLRPGEWSVFSAAQLADLDRTSSDPARIAEGNVANARLYQGDTRSLIENAVGGSGSDTIRGNQAANDIDGGANRDTILGQGGHDTLSGGSGVDVVNGGNGNDILFGNGGLDLLRGGNGNDTLVGGAHADRSFGGAGADIFVFEKATDSGLSQASDRIGDFEAGIDHIDFSGLSAAPVVIDILGGFSGAGPSAITRENGSATIVMVDLDGDKATDMRIVVQNTLGLTEGDFLV